MNKTLPEPRGTKQDAVEKIVRQLIIELGEDPDDPNLIETPRRFATYLLEHFIPDGEITSTIGEFATKTFPSNYSGMLIQRITAIGMCPHHLLPIIYHGRVGYIPYKKTIGLSKLARISRTILAKPLLQETATSLLAETLQGALETEDVAVLLFGSHQCMAIRGVRESDAVTVTSQLLGAFFAKPEARAEFMDLSGRIK